MLVGDEELSGRAGSRLGVQGRAIQTSVGPGAGIGDAYRQAVRSGDQGQPQSDNLSGDA